MKFIYVLLFCGAALVACEKQKSASPAQEREVPVRTARVVKASSAIEVAGTVRSNDVASLASRTAGFVSRVHVYAGSRVKKNHELISVDDRNLRAQLEKLKAAGEEVDQGIREARHQLEGAESQKRLASNTFERISELYRKNAASKQEFEEAEARKQAADSSREAARERAAQAESRKKQIASDLQDLSASFGYVRIVAPFDGVVTSVPVDQGTFVNPGQTLVSMESSSYQIQFFVEESLLSSVRKGQPVNAFIPAIAGDPVQATISEVSASLDTGTRTF
ncbi:MAG TPA: efflux RND transporter periplasmic adaptor subunit, partial [Acidobacteriota bacterium]